MNQGSDRPKRSRKLYLTLELCKNKAAGPFGSVELIESSDTSPYTETHLWPLGEHGQLTVLQVNDLAAVVMNLVTETVFTRINDQLEIPGLLGS